MIVLRLSPNEGSMLFPTVSDAGVNRSESVADTHSLQTSYQMKNLLIVALLLTSSCVYAGQVEDDADELAAENIGMTLQGYRASAAYKAKNANSSKRAECSNRSKELDADRKKLEPNNARLERRFDQHNQMRSSLDFRRDMLNSTSGGATGYLRRQWERDAAEFKSEVAQLNLDKAAYNRIAKSHDRDIDSYNEDCTE